MNSLKIFCGIIAPFLLILIFSGCPDFLPTDRAQANEISSPPAVQAVRIARSTILIYGDILMERRISTLQKGESVTLLEELAHPFKVENSAPLRMAHIKLSDGRKGFREMRFFALRAVVIIDEGVPLYNRADEGAAASHALAGCIAIVTSERENWLQVDVYRESGSLAKGKWINRGYSDDREMVSDALTLDRIRELTAETGEAENADIVTLKRLALSESAIGILAQRTLAQLIPEEGDGIVEEDKQ